MREMKIPVGMPAEVLDACIGSIGNEDLRNRVLEVRQNFIDASASYRKSAEIAQLYTFLANHQKDEEILVGNVTKGEVKNLYTYNLVKKIGARSYYDSILAAAPRGICPLCGVGMAATLDHYMPKAKFPLFSVLPLNLVPACRDCNTGKLAEFGEDKESQSLHPYFDISPFVTEQWIFAEVLISSPATIRFFVSAPDTWLRENKERAKAHFDAFKLAARFSIMAANELSSLTGMLADYVSHSGPGAVREFLTACATTELALHKNSWRAAFFQALAANDWFCEKGYL